ncbi:aminoglycoside phosphotransferase family protein [Actinoplanes sp. NPDC026619]|uniref:aminoglycoside phosphotransferase family protein n=1 Tax=Actinoplanes sp. NPDC026619 TaxID=3155798 RepID=UPI0033F97905
MDDPQVLQDSPHRRVVRIGDTVRRPLHPWSATIHELLQHLESVGFTAAARFLGIDDEGREVLTYLDGDSGAAGWSRVLGDEGLTAMARLLRDYHDAVADFRPSAPIWAGATGPAAGGEVVCHGDFGPWNLVWHGNRPVGILDWDYAWPQPPLHDVAYALEYVAPFRSDDHSRQWMRYPAPPDRHARMERFGQAYGISDFEGLAEAVVAQQEAVLARVRRLAAEGRQPQVDWQNDGWFEQFEAQISWSREFLAGGR